ncbi:unnamed protein product [Symbiodinium sp. CCMP2456]|nr:unnamed protein product [Symbiodinium sp. CCMP2456]
MEEFAGTPDLAAKTRLEDVQQLKKRGISVIASLVRQSMSNAPDVKGAKKTKVIKGRESWVAGLLRNQLSLDLPLLIHLSLGSPALHNVTEADDFGSGTSDLSGGDGAGEQPKPVGKGGAKGQHPAFARIEQKSRGITKPDLRRLARRAGVQRVAGGIYDEVREVITGFLQKILRDAAVYAEHARRKTVVPMDIVLSLRRRGQVIVAGFAPW